MTENIANRARSGAKVLALRNAVTQVLRIASSVVVARWLSPEDFGLFAVLIYISGLPMYVQNLGLGGALIQQREEPTQEQWSSAFFLQLIASVLLYTLIIAAGPLLLRLFDAPATAYGLLVTGATPSVFAALGFYQSVWLQRHLEFKKFATATFAGDVVSVASLCVLAVAGAGIWTLVLAPLLAAIVASAVLLVLRPWVPMLIISVTALRPLVRVGVPMQVNATLPVALNGWVPFYASRLLGAEALGFLNLAQRLAAMPASYLQILNQVALPSFSRLQADSSELMARLGIVLYRIVVVSGCAYLFIVPWVPDVVDFVYGARWRFAGHFLQYLGISIVLIAMTGVIGPALNALGRHWLRTIPMLCAYGLAWCCAPFLMKSFNENGLGMAVVVFAVIQLTGLAVCLPVSSRGRAKIVLMVAGTALSGLCIAFLVPAISDLGSTAKLSISAGGLLLAGAVTFGEWLKSDETTFGWIVRMLMPRT